MDTEHTAHVTRILTRFNKELTKKYEQGQQEHGGNLWLKSGMLDLAIEEVIDLVVYLYTLREQLRSPEPAAYPPEQQLELFPDTRSPGALPSTCFGERE
jgi:hypothetical protein